MLLFCFHYFVCTYISFYSTFYSTFHFILLYFSFFPIFILLVLFFIAFILFPLTYLSINILHAIHLLVCFCYSRIGSCTIYQSLRGHVVCLVPMYTPTRAEHDFLYGPFRGPCSLFQTTCPRPIALHSRVPLANYSPLHNSLLPPLTALSVIPTNHVPPFPMTSQPLHPARSTLFIFQSASRWRPARKSTLLTATNIAQH